MLKVNGRGLLRHSLTQLLKSYRGSSQLRSPARIVLHLPRTAPWGKTWRRLAVAVAATPG
jgi:hypothetical protein